MRYLSSCITLLISCQLYGQVAFFENFDSISPGLDLTTMGYNLSLDDNYTGTVFALVAENDSNQYAKMVSSPNGAARMEITKSIQVEPGKIYTYEVDSRGPFKRQIRVYSMAGELISSSDDYKPSTESEQETWKNLKVMFLSPPLADSLTIGFFHYWSGTIDLDNFMVLKVGEPAQQSAYYLSSSSGDDNNPGSKESPWKSLGKINQTFIFPGDSIMFCRGDTFYGRFIPNGSGTEEDPVFISSYGEGNKPVFSGQVGEENGGDYQEAIYVLNNDHLVFEALEVQNERLVSRNGISDTDAFGVHVNNNGTRVMRNLVFRNMVFKNVFAVQPILDPDDFNSISVAGLAISSSKNTVAGSEKNIRDIIVEDCYFENIQRFGIKFNHGGGNAGIGNDSLNRNMNIVIRNNEFFYNGGTGVLPNSTYNCLIENNIFDHPGASTDPRMPGRGSSIWNYNSINTIMQYNMCLSARGYLDSHGIHIDNKNRNTFVQYNYMEDCEGGFVEILKENINSVYRFNVSVNDGWRVNENWADSNHTIWLSSARWSNTDGNLELSDSCFIYNNTVIIDKPFTTAISMDAKNIFVYNNIFSSTNGGGMGIQHTIVRSNDTPFFMSNNLFEGNVDNRFVSLDAMPQLGAPLFKDSGEFQNVYEILPGSPAIDNGVNNTGPAVHGAGIGVFKDVPAYPDVDFFGNPINLLTGKPNIGACNIKNPEDTTDLTMIQPEQKKSWLVYPQPANSKIYLINQSTYTGPAEFFLTNLKGQVAQTERMQISPGNRELVLNLNSALPNGIYILNMRYNGGSKSRRIVLYR